MLRATLEVTLMLLGMIAVGCFMAKRPLFSGGKEMLHVLLTKVLLPANIFHAVVTNFAYDLPLGEVMSKWFYALIILSFVLLLALIMVRFVGIDPFRRSVVVGLITYSNVVLIGFPIIQSVLGAQAITYGVFYFTAFQLFFWTTAPVVLLRANGEGVGEILSLAGLKKIVTPALIAVVLGVIFAVLRVPIPAVISGITGEFTKATLAMSMLFIGTLLAEIKLAGLREYAGDLLRAALLKNLLMPVVSLLLLRLLPLDELGTITYFLLTMMPVAVNFSVITYDYECDYRFCSVAMPILTLVGVAAIPIYVVLLDWLPNLI
jgi:predicted permease